MDNAYGLISGIKYIEFLPAFSLRLFRLGCTLGSAWLAGDVDADGVDGMSAMRL
jgi:hypothetical protein